MGATAARRSISPPARSLAVARPSALKISRRAADTMPGWLGRQCRSMSRTKWTLSGYVLAVNPFTYLLTSYRNVAYSGTGPDWVGLAAVLVVSVVFLAFAIWTFKRSRRASQRSSDGWDRQHDRRPRPRGQVQPPLDAADHDQGFARRVDRPPWEREAERYVRLVERLARRG